LRSDGSIQRSVVGAGGGGRSRESCVTRSWNWQALDAELRGIDRQDVWQAGVLCTAGALLGWVRWGRRNQERETSDQMKHAVPKERL
jgi:hypothetical protein